ncbi:DNA-binding protein RFXANK isoform X1 [Lucilia cuprina]|uniref:DNA-binding protein RFXANK isoform X1 n=2 Tax=Lucilia cuprina TaxID=7375 RepID=UPI001F067688|nr:DNA-binding protein RFXANK isoform X1 [Lucilia cuprina]
MSSSPAKSPAINDDCSRLKMLPHTPPTSQEFQRQTETPSPTNTATSTPLSTPNSLHSSSFLHDPTSGSAPGKHKSAFLPYRPQATVLTNLQRGNTEATFCPVEVKLSFHERAGQGEVTEEQIHQQKASDIDAKDSFGFTPLHWACYYGQLATVQPLIEAGANVNEEAPEMVTPILLAASGGHHEVVRLLLEKGADYRHMDIVGNTALMYAAAGNHPHTCNELLGKDPEILSTANENGDTAYSLSIENGATLAQAVLEQYLTSILSL